MFSTKKGNLFALFFVIHFLAGNLVLALLLANFPTSTSVLPAIGLTQILLVFMPSFYHRLLFRTPIKSTFRLYKTNPLNFLLSALLALTSIPLVMLVNLISQFMFKPALDETLSNIGNENYLLAILVIAVFPGIFEELISRGIILSHYRNHKILVTSTFSGFFFGMMHMNMNQFMYAFVIGFLLSIVVHITGSIFTSMIMHFIINATNLSLAYLASSDLFSNLPGYDEQQVMMEQLDHSQLLLQSLGLVIFLLIVSLPFFLGILFIMIMVNDKWDLLKANALSYEFFQNELPLATNQVMDDELPLATDQIMDMEIPTATPPKERILTVPIAITVIIFIAVAVLTEILPTL